MISPSQPAPARPLIIAHRGGRHIGPENTTAAFDQGLAAGADGLEMDVHLSADGQVVVIHDAHLDRTTDARGPVAARTAAELASLDAGARFVREGAFPWRGRGVAVPRLAEVLARYPAVPLIIEMKTSRRALGRAVAAEVLAAGAADRVCIAGFRNGAVHEIRRSAPELSTSATREETRWALYRSWIGLGIRRHPPYRAFQLPECSGRTRVISPPFIRSIHRAGCAVQVWTVNDAADMRRVLDWGVDGLITDDPALAVQVRDEWVRARVTNAD